MASPRRYEAKYQDMGLSACHIRAMPLSCTRPSCSSPAPRPSTQDDNFNNTAGLYDIWLQQIKTSWREAPNNASAASRLTPDLKDLLDRMFDVKQVCVCCVCARVFWGGETRAAAGARSR